MRPLLLVMVFLTFSTTVRAEWVQAEGSYIFSPVMPESEACQYAEERAQSTALRKVLGENFASEDVLRCTEQSDIAECTKNSAIWSTVDGFIRDIRGRTTKVLPNAEGHRECIVGFEANVQAAHGYADPNFDLGVSLNESVFRDGDTIVISLSPSQGMNIQVFQWLPYEKGSAAVLRLYPNPFEPTKRIEKSSTIPSEAAAKNYALKVGFPQGMPPGRAMVDEYLIIIASKDVLNLRDSYDLDDFRRVLSEIPRDRIRIVRRAYNVVRGAR